MTRKDFTAIADGLVAMINHGVIKKKYIDEAINEMAYRLSLSNDRFDFTKFKKYIKERVCGQ